MNNTFLAGCFLGDSSVNQSKIIAKQLKFNINAIKYSAIANSPLEKRDETWGESHLAMACGVVSRNNPTRQDSPQILLIFNYSRRLRMIK